jgi:hypothetical protein
LIEILSVKKQLTVGPATQSILGDARLNGSLKGANRNAAISRGLRFGEELRRDRRGRGDEHGAAFARLGVGRPMRSTYLARREGVARVK